MSKSGTCGYIQSQDKMSILHWLCCSTYFPHSTKIVKQILSSTIKTTIFFLKKNYYLVMNTPKLLNLTNVFLELTETHKSQHI